MNPIARQPTSRTVINYTLAGAAFGGLFPLGAWVLDALTHDAAWSLATIWRLHLTNPLHWIIDSAPFVLGVFAYQIGRREQAEKAWRENEERYRSVFEDSPISLWEEDFSGVKAYLDRLRQDGVTDFREYFEKHPEAVTHCGTLVKVVDVNTATLTLYGARSKGELLNNLERVFTPESYPIFREELIRIAEAKTVYAHEGVNRTLQGETLHISLRWSVVPGYEATFARVLVSLIDITERKQAEGALRESELRFRNLFENSPDAVFVEDFEGKVLDVDRFKLFNDTFGHDAGDALLRELGNFLRAHIRGEDVACRYGGEEFMLILPEASLAVTRERAEHLRDDIKHLHAQYHDQPLGAVMLSQGVAVFPDHGSTGEAVLKAADAALYRAKREGRDRVVVAG